ncbi:Crp/Fnr family transcriptional regulator [candidate division KSB1 bacterium]|nr:Crp/Fnr family transcriptional regulator [candidate division KSB1 bacterium]
MPLSKLRQIPLFSELEDNALSELAKSLKTQTFRKDTTVVSETDEGSMLYIINKGQVKISRLSETGKEVILAILGEGDFFGEMSLLDGLARSANVITLTEAELFVLYRGTFLKLIEKNPKIAIGLLKELALRLRKSDTQIKSLSLFDATGRVATTLIQIAEDSGTIKDGTVKIQNLPNQRDLANIAGTSRETISRILKAFVAEGTVTKEKGKLFINDYDRFKKKYG